MTEFTEADATEELTQSPVRGVVSAWPRRGPAGA